MIAATYTQGGGFCVEDLPVPQTADDELLVHVMASSICGTDLRTIRSGHRKLAAGQKIVLGHEFAGLIVQAGRRAGPWREGQRIGVAPNIGCGQCEMCVRGMPNMCPDYTAFGITLDGGHAEYVRIPQAAIAQGSVCPLPDGLAWAAASLVEPLSCVVNGIRAARIALGDSVLVLGAGPIGLMHLLVAGVRGAGQVILADVQPERLAVARRLGATSTVDPAAEDLREHVLARTAGRGADVVITACSAPAVQEESLGLLAPFGRVCFFGGLPKDGSLVRLDTNLIHYRQLLVTGVTGGSPRDFRTALRLIASGRVDVQEVVSHRFATGQLSAAFDAAQGRDALKVVIDRGANTRA